MAKAVCESTGGYERLLVSKLREAEFTVQVAHPPGTRLRPGLWLRGQDRPSRRPGLSRYGVVFPESDTPQPEPDREELRQQLSRRRQLVEQRIQERNRLDKGISASVAKSTGHHIHWLDEEIEQLNEEYQEALRRSPDLCGRAELYRSVPGVGQLTADSCCSGCVAARTGAPGRRGVDLPGGSDSVVAGQRQEAR